MGVIKRAWRGEEKLWKTYWILGWVCLSAFGIVVEILSKIVPLLGILGILSLPYTIMWMISCWRCAWNCAWKGWGYIVRGLILFVVLVIPVGIIAGGVKVGRELIRQAECKKEFQAKAQQQGVSWYQYKDMHADEFNQCVGFDSGKKQKTDESMRNLDGAIQKMNQQQPQLEQALDKADAAFGKLDVALKKQAQEKKCVNALHLRAAEKNLDPIDYEVHNQVWIRQCVQAAEAAANACEQKMTEYAIANNADPKAYIAANQAYLQQCIAQSAPVPQP